jgi:integrase
MAIGPHGKITTEEARKLALAVLGSVVRGSDPADDRAQRRASVTTGEICDRYLAAAEKGLILGKGGRPKKASTLATDRGRVAHHIKPLLGRKPVADLNHVDIARFVRDVASGKTAMVKKTNKKRGKAVVEGGAGTATRTTGLLGGILSFAVSEGIIDANPARGVRRPADGQRTRRLTACDYAALGASLTAAERDGAAWQGVAGIRILALTGARLSEVAELEWGEVDLARQTLRLKDTKTDASTRPFGKDAVHVLRNLPKLTGHIYVLPGARGGAFFGGLPRMLARIVANARLEGVTAHTLRHSFASMAGDLEYADATIGAMIGHKAATITGRYNHRLDSALVAAADKVSGAIAAAMTGHA